MTNEQNLARRGSPQSATPAEPSQKRSKIESEIPGAPTDQGQQRDNFEASITEWRLPSLPRREPQRQSLMQMTQTASL
jgi:hypothetical protein